MPGDKRCSHYLITENTGTRLPRRLRNLAGNQLVPGFNHKITLPLAPVQDIRLKRVCCVEVFDLKDFIHRGLPRTTQIKNGFTRKYKELQHRRPSGPPNLYIVQSCQHVSTTPSPLPDTYQTQFQNNPPTVLPLPLQGRPFHAFDTLCA